MQVIHYPVSIENQSSTYITPYDWESSFNIVLARKWVSSTRNLVVGISIFYIVAIFSIQSYMKNKQPLKLRNPLAIWNTVLAILSILAFVRMIPEFSTKVLGGLHGSICYWKSHNITTAYWVFVLLLLKIVELGDTIFVVLRKQKLLFLHWYHHFTVLIGSWLSYEIYEPRLLWFVTVNAFVHGIMYSYYALKALGVKIPRQCSMIITTIQLSQMVMGISVNLYGLISMLLFGKSVCSVSALSIQIGFVLYIPFLYLFAKYFINTYFRDANVSKNARTTKQE